MKRSTRYLLYLVGGGVLITWLQPPAGVFTIAVVLALIFASAYLDAWLFSGMDGTRPGATLTPGEGSRLGRAARGRQGRTRPAWQAVFDTPYQDEVEVLLRDLRDHKLHPLMVTQRQNGEGGFIYVVRLLEHEAPRARRVIERFRRHAIKQPS